MTTNWKQQKTQFSKKYLFTNFFSEKVSKCQKWSFELAKQLFQAETFIQVKEYTLTKQNFFSKKSRTKTKNTKLLRKLSSDPRD